MTDEQKRRYEAMSNVADPGHPRHGEYMRFLAENLRAVSPPPPQPEAMQQSNEYLFNVRFNRHGELEVAAPSRWVRFKRWLFRS